MTCKLLKFICSHSKSHKIYVRFAMRVNCVIFSHCAELAFQAYNVNISKQFEAAMWSLLKANETRSPFWGAGKKTLQYRKTLHVGKNTDF